MLQVRQFRTSQGARAFALALIAASLVAMAAVGGYEFGSVTRHSSGMTTTILVPQQSEPNEPLPIDGLQP